ncbi:MAG TPA: hypothetical protein VFA38_03170, partial [Nitrospirales bacterium]|nr:hypothetical protein [Nitrospirales bacterium]
RSESKTDAPREPAAAARPQAPALEHTEAKAIRQLAVPLAVRITTTTVGGQRQLLVEANQPAYLTAILTAADGRRQPQIPEASSLRLIPHGSTAIPLPAGVPGDRLRVRVSTMPPVTDALEKSKAASIVTERLQEARPDGAEETVTYVTAADPAAPELHIDFIAR